MNTRNLSITLLVIAVMTSPAAAQDLTGTWELSAQGGRGGPQTMTLVLAQDGEEVTGTLTRTFGGRSGGGGAIDSDVENGTVDGNNFSFQVTLSFGGNSFTQSFSGTIDSDSMEGMIEGGRGQGRPFSGERKN